MFLEECKHIVKEKKDAWVYYWRHGTSSDDSDREDSDEETYNEENSY